MQHDEQQAPVPDFEGEEMKLPENTDTQPQAAPESTSVINGPLLIGLTVLLVLILGGMYYWFSTLSEQATAVPEPTPAERPTPEENNEPESTTAEAEVETMQALSPSDEISAIEADLEATNLETLDAELDAIAAELDAAMPAQ